MTNESTSPSRALRALELSEARWQAILDTARDAVVCIGSDGAITLFNRTATDIFGYEAAEVLGQNVSMLMPAPYRDEHDGYLARYRATGVPRAIGRIREVEARRKDGEVFPIELSVSEARVGDDVIYSAIIRDMSERRAMESELTAARHLAQQRERLADIGAITARIVHDLGNPLAGISMQARLIERRAERDPAAPATTLLEPATRIVAEVRRLDRLIKEFLDFARQQRLETQPVVLPSLLRELVEMWAPLAAERGITLTLSCEDVPPIAGDPDKLRRVMENLLKNAVEAIDHGAGTVAVRVQRHGSDVRVTVADDGPGIASGVDVFRLFETTKRDGSGLGLPIAKQIVMAHRGRIGYEAGHPRGALFHVDLPASL